MPEGPWGTDEQAPGGKEIYLPREEGEKACLQCECLLEDLLQWECEGARSPACLKLLRLSVCTQVVVDWRVSTDPVTISIAGKLQSFSEPKPGNEAQLDSDIARILGSYYVTRLVVQKFAPHQSIGFRPLREGVGLRLSFSQLKQMHFYDPELT